MMARRIVAGGLPAAGGVTVLKANSAYFAYTYGHLLSFDASGCLTASHEYGDILITATGALWSGWRPSRLEIAGSNLGPLDDSGDYVLIKDTAGTTIANWSSSGKSSPFDIPLTWGSNDLGTIRLVTTTALQPMNLCTFTFYD